MNPGKRRTPKKGVVAVLKKKNFKGKKKGFGGPGERPGGKKNLWLNPFGPVERGENHARMRRGDSYA